VRPALDLEALRLTLESWLEERVILEEQNGGVSVELLGPEGPGTRPIKPHILKHWFPRPTTIEQVLHWAMEAGIIEDSPEDRKDFFWMYKHYETSPPRMLDLECL
jgi:hypothetical protein